MAIRVGFLVCALVLASCSTPAADSATEPAATPDPTASQSPMPTASPSPMGTVEVTPSPQPSSTEPAVAADPLLAVELVDVRNGEAFTLGDLAADGPVLVEPMAIWCTSCRAQMHEVTAAHGLAEFHSVSIDVEPTEIAGDLAAYAAQQGYDWPFVLADATLATQLRDRFGEAVLFPPGTPKIVIRPDGSMELLPLNDPMSADEIAALMGG